VRELGDQVAFLGCPHGSRCNTSIHGVKETLEPQPPYLLRAGEVEYAVVDAEGAERTVRHRRHDFANTAQRYERVAALMAAQDAAAGAGGGGGAERTHWADKALGADVVVLDASAMWAVARAALEANRAAGAWPLTEATAEGAAENHHLVEGRDGSYRYRVGP